MCGIVGFVGSGDMDDLKRMNSLQNHRGPDEDGLFVDRDQHVFLGHKRLAIIDIKCGKQPMSLDAAFTIVFNGEIYNHLELRNILIEKGYKFNTDHSDTEVLLNGYLEWGTDLPNKLNGMWAFCIYDKKQKHLFCSRDRFGQKPFYYTLQKDTFIFASELTALKAHPCVDACCSEISLMKFFAYNFIPSPRTLYDGIYKLSAGHNLIFSFKEQRVSVEKYWDFVIEPFEKIPKDPVNEWSEELRVLLENAVKRRLIADVPVGVFLSGGIDSSTVAFFASKHTESIRLQTFNMAFDDPTYDESSYANDTAMFIKSEHRTETCSLSDAESVLDKILLKLDDPLGDDSLLPTYMLSNFVRKFVKVSLSGDGADELFAGYDTFKAVQLAQKYKALVPQPIHNAIAAICARLPVSKNYMSLDFKIKRMLRGLNYPSSLWNPVWLASLEFKEIGQLFGKTPSLEGIYSEAIELWDKCPQDNLIDRTFVFYSKMYLQDDILLKTDRASMMNSLEVRAPFLDIDLVDFIRKIPWRYKLGRGQTKFLLKRVLNNILPREIVHRRKRGFALPSARWFDDNKFDRYFKRDNKVIRNKDFVLQKLKEHRTDKANNREFLWNYLVSTGM